jgi:SAM-dependent methyltransferase
MSELERVRQIYETKYRIDYRNREYQWHPRNLNSLIHAHVLEWEVVRALNRFDIELVDQRILDVGCGYGRMLRFWAEMGGDPVLLFGCDVALYRLERARELSAGMQLVSANAGQLPFPCATFDLVSQFAVFSSIFDADVRVRAGQEMARVLRPGGWLLWYDLVWAGSGAIRPLPKVEVMQLFPGLTLRYARPLFCHGLSDRIGSRPRLAMIREYLPFGRRDGLILLFQRPES